MMASHPSKMLLAIIYMEFPYGQGNERNYFPKITLIYTIRKKKYLFYVVKIIALQSPIVLILQLICITWVWFSSFILP